MNKALWQILILITFLLTACGQSTPVLIIDNATSNPSPIPTATQTAPPTATPTASVTPLPTIPTFTPTFDVSTIVTVTSAPKAECPIINTTIKPEDYFPDKLAYPSSSQSNKILEFLNNGGDSQFLVKRLTQIYPEVDYTGGYDFRDVTGDQVPEFLYIEFQFEAAPIVFSCKNGRFEQIAMLSGDRAHHAYSMEIEDLNEDGTQEVIVIGAFCGSFCHFTIYLFGWNGQNFTNLAQVSIRVLREMQIKDLDGNQTKEILIRGDNPTCTSCSNFVPQRLRTVIYGWNGNNFVEISNEFAPPEYRFQAIQDADAAANIGKYDKAMFLYNQAISDLKLGWWSPDRLVYEQNTHDPVTMFIETPSVTPTIDPTEYPRLAAYAYYRIMLLHLVQNHEPEATTVYNTLQKKFGSNQYGHPYVEMATAFWDAYQSTHKMYDGCAAAIQYAAEHPEILTPLGSDYHGAQSHQYEPEDVCPFR